MAKIAASELQDAASRVSSTVPSASRGAGGIRDPEVPWALVQSKAGRALAATPDLVYYYAFLCSNRTSTKVREVVLLLKEIIPLAEGLRLEQAEVASPSGASSFYSLVSSAETMSSSQISALQSKVDKYISEELVPNLKAGSRIQKKGPEAQSAYETTKAALLKKWKAMKALMRRCSEPRRFTSDTVRSIAMELPLQSLGTTLGIEPEGAELTAYTLQLAAAMASVQAMGREIDHRYRVLVTESSAFPTGLTYSTEYEDAVVSGLSFSSSPKELGIRSGDKVTWGAGEATVSSVGDERIVLSSSTISNESGNLQISCAARSSWQTMAKAVSEIEAGLPSVAALTRKMQRKEGRSAAEVRDLIAYLAGLYAKLEELDSSTSSTLDRVGASVEAADETALEALDAYSPSFSSKVTKTGDAILADAENDGFDRGSKLLLEGDFDTFLSINSTEASMSGRLSSAVSTLSSYGSHG